MRLLTLAFVLLLRVQRAERLGYEQPGESGQLLGLDRCPSRVRSGGGCANWSRTSRHWRPGAEAWLRTGPSRIPRRSARCTWTAT